MKKLTILLFSIFISFNSSAGDEEIVINIEGVTITSKTPSGFYKTSTTYPGYFNFVEKYSTGKESKLLSWLVTEKDLLKLDNNLKPDSGRYINIKINKASIGENLTEKDFNDYKELVINTPSDAEADDIRKEYRRISRDIERDYNLSFKINRLKYLGAINLGIFINNENAIGLTRILTIEGEDILTKVVALSSLLVRGKLIYVYVLSTYRSVEDIIWVEEKSKEFIELILKNNN